VAGVLGDSVYLAQVGDSRAYLGRGGVAQQITKDQSLMQKLIEAGELTEEEAAQSERRNIILQALGPEATIKVDLTYQRIRRGDVLVLCSDGLSGQVTRDEISKVIAEEPDLVQACRKLIDLANEAGGPDNITVIIARFGGEGLNDFGEGDEVGHRVFALQDAGATPAVAMDRVMEAPTQPMRASRRAALPPARDESFVPTEPVPIIPPAPPASPAPPAARATPAVAATQQEIENDPLLATTDPIIEPPKTGAPDTKRRSRGMAVAVALLALLVLLAAWYAVRTVRKVQPEPTPAGQTNP